MSNVNTVNLGGTNYPIEDTAARSAAQSAASAAGDARTTADSAARAANVAQEAIELLAGDPSLPGRSLATVFADEIAAAPYSGNAWAWIQARIRAGNIGGIGIADVLQLTLSDGKSFNKEIAGINTYKGYGDTEVGNHIDFISRELHPDTTRFNPANYNNGTTVSPNPWLAS